MFVVIVVDVYATTATSNLVVVVVVDGDVAIFALIVVVIVVVADDGGVADVDVKVFYVVLFIYIKIYGVIFAPLDPRDVGYLHEGMMMMTMLMMAAMI